MHTNADTHDTERAQALLLARLLPKTKRGPSRKEVLDAIAPLLAVGRSSERAQQHAAEAWKDCATRRWLDEQPARLTALGRSRLCQILDLPQLPELSTWSAVQRDLLQPVALGKKPAKASKRSGVNLAAEVIQVMHGLPVGETLRQSVDRLAWRALGVDTGEPFQASRVQRHLLRELGPGDARVAPRMFRQQIALRAVGAQRADNESLRRAVIARWVMQSRQAPAQQAARPAPTSAEGIAVTANDNAIAGKSELAAFAAAVMDAARAPNVTRFHDDRAFIGSIWEHMRDRPPVRGMSLDAFKEALVHAHRAKLLRMSRADLVQAMDPAEVKRSEARYLNATFHFVTLQAGGVP